MVLKRFVVAKPILNCRESHLAITAGSKTFLYRIRKIPEGRDRMVEVLRGNVWILAAVIFDDNHMSPVNDKFIADVTRLTKPDGLVAQAVRCSVCGKWLERQSSMEGGIGPECRNKVYCKT